MIVAGIDPSLSGTAVVIGEPGEKPEHRVFRSHRIDDTVKGRFTRYENQVHQAYMFMRERACCFCVIEGYVMGGKGDMTRLAEYGALLRWHLIEFGDVVEVAPTTLKKFAAGRGGHPKNPVTKEVVSEALEQRYGVKFKTHDEYDAYALWRMACVLSGQSQPETVAQAESINAVLNPKPRSVRKSRKKSQPKAEKSLFESPPPF